MMSALKFEHVASSHACKACTRGSKQSPGTFAKMANVEIKFEVL